MIMTKKQLAKELNLLYNKNENRPHKVSTTFRNMYFDTKEKCYYLFGDNYTYFGNEGGVYLEKW